MYLFSFWGIVVSMLFIFGAFTLFSGQIDGRAKVVLIIGLSIVGFMLLRNMDIFKNANALVSGRHDATQARVISRDKIIQSSGNYSVSTWIYIDDWNYKFGEIKTVVSRENTNKELNPHIYLDAFKNDIVVEFFVNSVSGEVIDSSYDEALLWCLDNSELPEDSLTCSYDPETNAYAPEIQGVQCVDGTYECLDGTTPDISNLNCSPLDNKHSATLKNIPLQKWFNIIYAFGDNHTDIYLNGKLVHTKTFSGVQFASEFAQHDFMICPNGGFAGSISNANYYNYLVSPDKAFSIYKEGFGSVVTASLFSKYNTAVSFYEDNHQRAKYYIA